MTSSTRSSKQTSDHYHNCIPITVGVFKGKVIPVPLRKQTMWVCVRCDVRFRHDASGEYAYADLMDEARAEAIQWEYEIEMDEADKRFGWDGCKEVFVIQEHP